MNKIKRIEFFDRFKRIGDQYYKETKQACEGIILDHNTYLRVYAAFNRLVQERNTQAIEFYRLKYHDQRIVQILSMAVFIDYSKTEEHIQIISLPPAMIPRFGN